MLGFACRTRLSLARLALAPFLVVALTGCGASRQPSPAILPTAMPPAPGSIVVTYREAANVFEVMDNVSSWLPGKCDEEYRLAWQERFGVSADDELAFSAYKEIRERYYAASVDERDPRTSPGGLFGLRKPPDSLAQAFYAAGTIAEALVHLASFVKKEDVDAIRLFYARFQPRLDVLLAESKVFPTFASVLEQKLASAKTTAYVERVARAYGVVAPRRFTVLYVWWPPSDHTTASSRGDVLLLKYNPKQDADAAVGAVDIPIHELIHSLSGQQAEEQKRALTKTFLDGCDVTASIDPVRVLEEPLTVAQQKIYLRIVEPGRLDFSQPWYGAIPGWARSRSCFSTSSGSTSTQAASSTRR